MEMKFNQILILDSIPEGELNTAERLHAELQDRAQLFAPAPAPLYLKIASGRDFLMPRSPCPCCGGDRELPNPPHRVPRRR